MKRIIIIAVVSAFLLGLGIYWFRIPTTTHMKPISTKGWTLPDEVIIPDPVCTCDYGVPYPSIHHDLFCELYPHTRVPMFRAQKQVDGRLISYTVRSKKDALMAAMVVRSYYGIPEDAEFACVLDEKDDGVDSREFMFIQLYKGVPVQNGYFSISSSLETGELEWIDGCYEPMDGVDISVKPKISAYGVRQFLSLNSKQKVEKTSLTVFVYLDNVNRTNLPRLGWEIYTTGPKTYDHKLYFVDAQTGEIMHSEITLFD